MLCPYEKSIIYRDFGEFVTLGYCTMLFKLLVRDRFRHNAPFFSALGCRSFSLLFLRTTGEPAPHLIYYCI